VARDSDSRSILDRHGMEPADRTRAGARALGEGEIEKLAAKAGVPPQIAGVIAAQVLPRIIGHLTPGGQVPQQGGLGGLLGKLAG